MHSDRSAPIAQLVELLPLKEKVPGSSPGGGTRYIRKYPKGTVSRSAERAPRHSAPSCFRDSLWDIFLCILVLSGPEPFRVRESAARRKQKNHFCFRRANRFRRILMRCPGGGTTASRGFFSSVINPLHLSVIDRPRFIASLLR